MDSKPILIAVSRSNENVKNRADLSDHSLDLHPPVVQLLCTLPQPANASTQPWSTCADAPTGDAAPAVNTSASTTDSARLIAGRPEPSKRQVRASRRMIHTSWQHTSLRQWQFRSQH
ncbi:MAG: hypothetical protein F4124_08485 [Acidimicrobiia bacterium]|nr:hypothetical protein [bacterium]MXW59798.1 hypothetical protein [Acidimicrobiia bacterium]MYB73619.1 hypothetical protein [Acidimicrobiia bacterium]MYH99449.1 hypothetical protein [Acidimicrobiia bacterium]